MKKEQKPTTKIVTKEIVNPNPRVQGGRDLNKTNPFSGELGSLMQTNDDQNQQTSFNGENSALPIGTASRIFRKAAIMELMDHENRLRIKKAFPLVDQVPGVTDPSNSGNAGAPWSGAGDIQNLNQNNNPQKRYEEDEWGNFATTTKKYVRKQDQKQEIDKEDQIEQGHTLYTGDE